MFIILKNITYQKGLFSRSHKDDERKSSSRYTERATGDLLYNYFWSYILVFSIYLCQRPVGGQMNKKAMDSEEGGWVGEMHYIVFLLLIYLLVLIHTCH